VARRPAGHVPRPEGDEGGSGEVKEGEGISITLKGIRNIQVRDS
jgi:hypothetical protein